MKTAKKNPIAVALGQMAKGKKKTISEADRQRRREWAKGLAARRKKAEQS